MTSVGSRRLHLCPQCQQIRSPDPSQGSKGLDPDLGKDGHPGPGRTWTRTVLGQLRRDSPGLDSGPLGWPLFRCRTARSAPVLLFGRKRGTRKSRLETKTENEARSALLARLW